MEDCVFFDKNGINKIVDGINVAANAVKSTLGAQGKNVIIRNSSGKVHITKDGVTVANAITLKDEIENIGASLVKEVASKTLECAGDGTTTSIILTQALINYGMQSIKDGNNPVDVKIGIDKTVKQVVSSLKRMSKEVINNDILKQIITISANNDTYIGELLSEAFLKIGNSGLITVEDSQTYETFIEISTGLKIDRGYISSYFITDDRKMVTNFNNPYILIYDKKISGMKDLLPILEATAQKDRPLLIIAEDVDGEALSTLIVNKLRETIKVAAIKTPGFGVSRKELLQDIAIYTGGLVISEATGIRLSDVTLDMLGEASKIKISKNDCAIIAGRGGEEDIEARKEQIREQINTSSDTFEKELLKKRLSYLCNNAATLNVGGITETEITEKKDRIDDALRAAYSAIDGGFVSGGESAYLHAINGINIEYKTDSELSGGTAVRKALLEPFKQLLKNGNINSDSSIKEILTSEYGIGYNIKTNLIENLIESGIIDSTVVVCEALTNATSIATTFLNSGCVVIQETN